MSRRSPSPERRRPLFAPSIVALFLATLSHACGGGSAQGDEAVLARVPLRLAPDAEPMPDQRVTSKFSIPEDHDLSLWRIESRGHKVQHHPDVGPILLLQNQKVKGPKKVSFPGPFEPSTFDTVLLRLLNFEPDEFRIGLVRAGKPVYTSPYRVIPDDKQPQDIFFQLPRRLAQGEPFDEVFFETRGVRDLCAFIGLDLLAMPLEGRLVLPEDGEAPITIGGESRTGLGLSTRRPLEADVLVPPKGRLAFAYGRPGDLASAKSRLVVTITGAGGAPAEYECTLPPPGSDSGWLQTEIDLTPFGDRRAKLRFELRAGEVLDACAIAEPRIFVRGAKAPTVLLVTSDTHRYDYLGSTCQDGVLRTPRIDDLAASGVFFSDAFTATNVTNPSHIALMTATSPRDTQIVNNNTALSAAAPTLAEAFRAKGYVTYASTCASHLGHDQSGLGQGFDRLAFPPGGYCDAEDAVRALFEWLPDSEGLPLFVWLHFFDAHHPYGPPGRFDRMYWEKGTDPFDAKAPPLALPNDKKPVDVFPPDLAELRDLDFPRAQYRAEITYLDEQLGRVLDHPRFGASWVALTADHGESFGEHGVYFDHAGSYPTNLHVPLVLAGPDVPRGLRVDAPARQIDVGRTLLDLAGFEDVDFPGEDLLALARGERDGSEPRFSLSFNGFDASMTADGWHYVLQLKDQVQPNIVRVIKKGERHLFDLRKDPRTEIDLAGEPEQAERVRAMHDALVTWLRQARATGWAQSVQLTADQRAALESLGYTADVEVGGESRVWYHE